MPGLQLVSNALPSQVLGLFAGLLIDVPISVAATDNQLWIWNNGFYQSSAAALITTENRRRFAIYGNLIIVVDGVNVPYYYSSGFPTLAFQPLPNWPGNFGTINPSIVETTDYSTVLVQANSQVLWSSLVPQGPYIPSVPAQVYQYDLGQIPGDITAVHRLRSLLVVYRQNAFQCATFVGVDIGWDFGQPGTISEDIGAAGNECVVNTGDYHYIWGPDDFWQFDGYNLNRIPNNLKQFIFRDLDQGFFANVAGRYDVNRTLVFWHYPSINANPRGSLDSWVCLNLRTGKWGFGRLPIDLPLTGLMVDPISSQTTPDSGVALQNHALYLYDENASFQPAAVSPAPAPAPPFVLFITDQDQSVLWGYNSALIQTQEVVGGATGFVPNFSLPLGCIATATNVWVADPGEVQVLAFSLAATGNVAPTTQIKGAATMLAYPHDVAIGPITGDVYVADTSAAKILIFAANANGNAAPIATISAGLLGPYSVACDSHENVYVVDGSDFTKILVFAANTNALLATIQGVNVGLLGAINVRLDASDNIWICDYTGQAMKEVPPLGNATGTYDPVLTRTLNNAVLAPVATGPLGVTFDAAGNIYVAILSNGPLNGTVYQFASTAMGAAAPTASATLSGTGQCGGCAIPSAGTVTPSETTFTPMTYIVSNDFGDRHMVYSTRRLRPGFAQYPVPPNQVPTPVLITPLVQMTNTGTTPVAAFSIPIAPSGFGDLKVSGRLTRFRFDLFGTCEFAQGDVDLSVTGSV